jgi:hypothetical protein
MELKVKERLVLQKLLPKEANFLTLKLVRIAREALSFDEDEHKALNFKQDENGIHWDNDALVKDIELGETVTNIVVKELKKLDEQNKLTEDHFSLFEKFVDNK